MLGDCINEVTVRQSSFCTVYYNPWLISVYFSSQFYSILDMSEGLIFLHVDDPGGWAYIPTSFVFCNLEWSLSISWITDSFLFYDRYWKRSIVHFRLWWNCIWGISATSFGMFTRISSINTSTIILFSNLIDNFLILCHFGLITKWCDNLVLSFARCITFVYFMVVVINLIQVLYMITQCNKDLLKCSLIIYLLSESEVLTRKSLEPRPCYTSIDR